MKRILLILTILAVMIVSAGCEAGPVGYYICRSVSSGNITITETDARSLGLDPGSIKLCKSGRCELEILEEHSTGRWEYKDGKLTVKIKDKTYTGKIKNRKIVLKGPDGTVCRYSIEKILPLKFGI